MGFVVDGRVGAGDLRFFRGNAVPAYIILYTPQSLADDYHEVISKQESRREVTLCLAE